MLKRASTFVVAALLIALAAVAGLAQVELTKEQRELADYIKDHYTKREVYIPMRDGVKLFAAIYEPKDKDKKYPIMFDRTPYSVAPYGPKKFKNVARAERTVRPRRLHLCLSGCARPLHERRRVRRCAPLHPQQNRQSDRRNHDAYDTVDWLIKNVPNNNGRVGVWGISYPGFYTSTTGIDGHPAVKAISPQAPVSDWFHGDDMQSQRRFVSGAELRLLRRFGSAASRRRRGQTIM